QLTFRQFDPPTEIQGLIAAVDACNSCHPDVQVKFETLARQATYIYCDKDHHLAKATNVTLDDLLRQRWISPGYGDDEGP
ncbi:hypothetical protein AB9E19_34290, partial [Rhizobium leguminosarum]